MFLSLKNLPAKTRKKCLENKFFPCQMKVGQMQSCFQILSTSEVIWLWSGIISFFSISAMICFIFMLQGTALTTIFCCSFFYWLTKSSNLHEKRPQLHAVKNAARFSWPSQPGLLLKIIHMWLGGCSNPSKMEQSWERNILRLFTHINTKSAS